MFALTEGLWLIYDHYLTVRAWSPDFDLYKATIDRVMAWMRIPKLLIRFYNELVLSFIGDSFGRAVKVDFCTSNQDRDHYARICIEVDLSKPSIPSLDIEGWEFKVEYEGLHLLYLSCGCFGHLSEQCPEREKESPEIVSKASENATSQQVAQVASEESPQTVVQKRKRQRQGKEKAENLQERCSLGLRYVVLGELGGNEISQKEEGRENDEVVADVRVVESASEQKLQKGQKTKSNASKGIAKFGLVQEKKSKKTEKVDSQTANLPNMKNKELTLGGIGENASSGSQ